MIAGGSGDGQQVLVVVASVVGLEVAGELEKRQRGRGGTGGGAGGGVEREQGEASECTEEAKEANGEKEQEVEGQSGGGAEWRPEGRWCFEVRLSAQKRPRRRIGRRSRRWRGRVAEGR